MNDITFYKNLSDYIDGCMSGDDKKEFESNLSRDKRLEEKVDQIKELMNDIKGLNTLMLPDDFNSKLKNKIHRQKNSHIPETFNIFKLFDNPIIATISSIAAIILVVVTTNLSFSGIKEYNNSEYNQIAIFNEAENQKENQEENYDILKDLDLDIERVDYNLKYEDN